MGGLSLPIQISHARSKKKNIKCVKNHYNDTRDCTVKYDITCDCTYGRYVISYRRQLFIHIYERRIKHSVNVQISIRKQSLGNIK